VTAALQSADLPGFEDRPLPTPGPTGDLIGRFVSEAEAVNAEPSRVRGEAAALAAALSLMPADAAYLAWDDEHLPVTGFSAAAAGRGLRRVDVALPRDERRAVQHRIGDAIVGITGATCGLANSGSVILEHGPGRPRAASLLPITHIALLPAADIVATMADTLPGMHLDDTSNIVIITGPSRTGDIEFALTLGVHGPQRVHIIIIE